MQLNEFTHSVFDLLVPYLSQIVGGVDEEGEHGGGGPGVEAGSGGS